MTLAGSRPITAPQEGAERKQDQLIIDCDVHQTYRSPDELIPFLPGVYREIVSNQGVLVPASGYFNAPKRAARTDLAEDPNPRADYNGRHQGYDYDNLRENHLDPWNIDYALLTGSMYVGSAIPDADYAAAFCRALNDWTLEEWISRDRRFRMAMTVSTADPRLAVQEIDRIAELPEVVALILPTGSHTPYGNRYFHPIWEACNRHRLPVFVHPGLEGAGMAGPPTGVGYPTYYLETRLARPQMAMAHCASLICEGVFEKFSDFKFAFIEVDQFWVPGFMWHMDADWKSLREQTPWVKLLPSEYFRRHIRIGSQPLEEPERPEQLLHMLEAMHAEETLIYCSDWPHWDWDDPATTFPKLPEHLHKRIFSENARELLGL